MIGTRQAIKVGTDIIHGSYDSRTTDAERELPGGQWASYYISCARESGEARPSLEVENSCRDGAAETSTISEPMAASSAC